MNETAKPVQNNTSVDSLIESSDINAEDESFLSPRHSSPTFYTMLLFHRGFCEAAFDDSFSFLLQDDPYFGHNTFGQGARHMPERAAVMLQQINALKDGKWRGKPQFAKFEEALKKVPVESDHVATVSFYEKLIEKFLKLFEKYLEKHILNRWRNNKLIMYLIGGQPELAQQLARTLRHYDSLDGGISINDEGEEVNTVIERYSDYPDINITLNNHHTVALDRGPVKVNIKSTMTFLTEKADFRHILETDRFVKKHKALIFEMAMAGETVRLFDRNADGKCS